MKNLFIISIISLVMFSCQKETFTPNQNSDEVTYNEVIREGLEPTLNEVNVGQNQIDISFRVPENEPPMQGEVRIYFWDSLAYIIDASTLVFTPYGENEKATHIVIPCSNAQLIEANRWFLVQADFADTVSWMFNENKFNGKMTFCNESTIFPEPSFTIKSNFTSFSNAFYVKPVTTPTPPIHVSPAVRM